MHAGEINGSAYIHLDLQSRGVQMELVASKILPFISIILVCKLSSAYNNFYVWLSLVYPHII
jgi:hypothetical protein